MKEIDPKSTSRALAFELWMKAPMPMVTLIKTLDVTALVRMSLHEPIMPINFESNSKGGCCVIANELIALLAPYTGDIDLTNLQNYAGTSH